MPLPYKARFRAISNPKSPVAGVYSAPARPAQGRLFAHLVVVLTRNGPAADSLLFGFSLRAGFSLLRLHGVWPKKAALLRFCQPKTRVHLACLLKAGLAARPGRSRL